MTRRVLDADHEFGVVLIERGSEVGGGDVRFDVGTVARIVQAAEMPDGRYALATVGMRRVRVVRVARRRSVPAGRDRRARRRSRGRRRRRGPGVVSSTRSPRSPTSRAAWIRESPCRPTIDADPVRASFEAAALAPIGPLDAQRVLEAEDARPRLALLAAMLDERADELRARLD